jgi:hypothetical protein
MAMEPTFFHRLGTSFAMSASAGIQQSPRSSIAISNALPAQIARGARRLLLNEFSPKSGSTVLSASTLGRRNGL